MSRTGQKAGARIESEHVVEVIGAGVDSESGIPWLSMELLQGDNLEAHVQARRPMPSAQVIDVLDQVAHALGQAHALGIIHRDLKPENRGYGITALLHLPSRLARSGIQRPPTLLRGRGDSLPREPRCTCFTRLESNGSTR